MVHFVRHVLSCSLMWISNKHAALSEHPLNVTAFLSILADRVHPFMAAMNPSSSRTTHHVTKLKSRRAGFLNMTILAVCSTFLNLCHEELNHFWRKKPFECISTFDKAEALTVAAANCGLNQLVYLLECEGSFLTSGKSIINNIIQTLILSFCHQHLSLLILL